MSGCTKAGNSGARWRSTGVAEAERSSAHEPLSPSREHLRGGTAAGPHDSFRRRLPDRRNCQIEENDVTTLAPGSRLLPRLPPLHALAEPSSQKCPCAQTPYVPASPDNYPSRSSVTVVKSQLLENRAGAGRNHLRRFMARDQFLRRNLAAQRCRRGSRTPERVWRKTKRAKDLGAGASSPRSTVRTFSIVTGVP